MPGIHLSWHFHPSDYLGLFKTGVLVGKAEGVLKHARKKDTEVAHRQRLEWWGCPQPEAGRGNEGFLAEPPEGGWHLRFILVASRRWANISAVLSHPACGNLCPQPWDRRGGDLPGGLSPLILATALTEKSPWACATAPQVLTRRVFTGPGQGRGQWGPGSTFCTPMFSRA